LGKEQYQIKKIFAGSTLYLPIHKCCLKYCASAFLGMKPVDAWAKVKSVKWTAMENRRHITASVA